MESFVGHLTDAEMQRFSAEVQAAMFVDTPAAFMELGERAKTDPEAARKFIWIADQVVAVVRAWQVSVFLDEDPDAQAQVRASEERWASGEWGPLVPSARSTHAVGGA